MPDIEVHISLDGTTIRIGTLYRRAARGRESVVFEYHPDWLAYPARFSLEPALSVGEGQFHPGAGRDMFGSIGDSAPDTWGRRLMQRAERRRARRERCDIRTLQETDYLLGVTDVVRLGALRFKRTGDVYFQAPLGQGVPGFLRLVELMASADRIERGEESDEDLQTIFAPGSSLGGARPKASVVDDAGALAIAKFPKENDDYSIETWERIALQLASDAGIDTPLCDLRTINGRAVLLSWRFDRAGEIRFPFLSAMAMLQLKDGDRASYPEIVDEMARHSAHAKRDARELYRRMVLNILISNVDDHLRNHGFLWAGKTGWILAPVYDLNPTPTDLKARILTTNISLDEGTCSLELAESQAGYFGLSLQAARTIAAETARVVENWRAVAAGFGEPAQAIERMATAFEHGDLRYGLKFT